MQLVQRVKDIARERAVLLCMVAMVFITLQGVILNAEIYARMAPYFGVGRELSTLFGAVAFLVLAVVSVRKPSLLDARQISFIVVPTLVVASFLLALALEQQNPAFILIAQFCRGVGLAWAMTMFSVALTTVSSLRNVMVAVGVGMVAAGLLWQVAPRGVPIVLACVLVMLCSIIPILLTWRISIPRFEAIRQSSTATDLGVSGFSGFSAFRGLLLCMLLVGCASGYALAFNEESNAPVTTIVENIVVAVVVVVVLASGSKDVGGENEDRLFSLVVLLIIAGFLVAPLSFGSDATVANALLRAGRDCFNLLLWVLLASFGRRNIFLLLPLLGMTRCMNSLGIDVGAVAGHVSNGLIVDDPWLATVITTAFVFAFIAFLWLGFRDFSFAQAIGGVKPVSEPELLQVSDHIEARCRLLGEQRGLTERETDILGLLAKGRDGRFIADEYVLSYNTVKTHIKHIYQKLDVHSRQELIDLVGGSL